MMCHQSDWACFQSLLISHFLANLFPPPAEDDDMNEDTVERIVRCIIQNEGTCRQLSCFPHPWFSLALTFTSTDSLFPFSPQPMLRP